MRTEVPTDVDMQRGARDESVRDVNVAYPSNKADDARRAYPVLPRKGESLGGQDDPSSPRGGHRGGPPTLTTEHRPSPSGSVSWS